MPLGVTIVEKKEREQDGQKELGVRWDGLFCFVLFLGHTGGL